MLKLIFQQVIRVLSPNQAGTIFPPGQKPGFQSLSYQKILSPKHL
ncbi:MAG: hypothetical protein Ct9H300mP28_00030 [Pseudomonadota bacterium]|nr:MAG: hypothetical protein Ct9H300mP28_00030 [Pseudomonadota bacterium]